MTETGATAATTETPKGKKLRKVIEEKLAITLLEYKQLLGEKKI